MTIDTRETVLFLVEMLNEDAVLPNMLVIIHEDVAVLKMRNIKNLTPFDILLFRNLS